MKKEAKALSKAKGLKMSEAYDAVAKAHQLKDWQHACRLNEKNKAKKVTLQLDAGDIGFCYDSCYWENNVGNTIFVLDEVGVNFLFLRSIVEGLGFEILGSEEIYCESENDQDDDYCALYVYTNIPREYYEKHISGYYNRVLSNPPVTRNNKKTS